MNSFFSYLLFSSLLLIFFIFMTNLLTSTNLIFSLLYLITIFIFMASFFIFLGVDFVGYMLIIVYVGAITMLFLFVLMLFDIPLINTQRIDLTKFFFLHFGIYLILFLLIFLNKFYIALFFNTITIVGSNIFDIVSAGLYLYCPSMVGFLLLIGFLLFIIVLGACTLLSVEVSFY